MAVISTAETYAFDTSAISKGDFIRVKYHTWDRYQNGLVARITSEAIKVFYVPPIGNITNFFIVPAAEVADGLWSVETSPDFETIETTEETSDDTDDETEETEETTEAE